MENRKKALQNALGSTQMEGMELDPEMVEMIHKALELEKHDKSFLYELAKLIQEKKEYESRKK